MSKPTESQIAITYGNPKIGKTTDLGFTFPTGYFFAPSASSLLPLKRIVGIKPKTAVVGSLHPVLDFVREHAQDESIPAIVIDDIALLSERSIKIWQQENAGWYAYQQMLQAAIELCVTARHAPWHLVLDSHSRPPENTDVGFVRGGPILPGRKAGPELEKNASIILRAEVGNPLDPAGGGGATEDWAGVYVCDQSDPNWTVGDRNGFALKSNPMNLREILHAGGVTLPRVYDWQEEMVETLSDLAMSKKLTEEILAKADAKMVKLGANESAIAWTHRDATARVYCKQHRSHRAEGVRKSLLGVGT